MHLTTLPDFVFVLFHTFVPSEVWRTRDSACAWTAFLFIYTSVCN